MQFEEGNKKLVKIVEKHENYDLFAFWAVLFSVLFTMR